MAVPPITFAPPPAVIGRWRSALVVIFTSLLVMSGMASNAWASSDCDPLDAAAPGVEACDPCDPVSGESPVITETEAAAESVCDPCDPVSGESPVITETEAAAESVCEPCGPVSDESPVITETEAAADSVCDPCGAISADASADADADADAEPCPAPQEATPLEEPVVEATVPELPATPQPSSGPEIPRLPESAPAAPTAPAPNPALAPNPAATTTTPTTPTTPTTLTSPRRTPSPSSDVGAQGGMPSLLEASDDAFEFGPSEDAPPLVLPGPPTDSGAPPGTSLDDGFAGFDQVDIADLIVPSPDVAGADRDLAFESQGGRNDRGLPEPRTAPPATDDAGGGDAIPVDRDQRAPALLLLLGVLGTGLLAATTLESAPRAAPEVSPPRRLGLLRGRPRSPKP